MIEAVLIDQYENFQAPATPTTIAELSDFFLLGVSHQKQEDYFLHITGNWKQLVPKYMNYKLQRFKRESRSYKLLLKPSNKMVTG
ncbi:hypothetical protein [Listeria seeligeri]|uniref:hypothetical protein n=1 Tax=Listeria seeligeri TaxID=1640 RepID=UPI0022EAC882|nr:hypothetical protein [Listeria seeligeri]